MVAEGCDSLADPSLPVAPVRRLPAVRGEPVRGVIPEPCVSSLPGIDRVQALRQGLIARPPLARLTGMTVTQAGPGTATMVLPASPWLDVGYGLDPLMLGEVALSTAVLTGAPAGADVRTASLSATQFRPPELDADLIAHARTLVTSNPRFTFGEVAIEDSRGRAVAVMNGAVLVEPRDPPPPPAPPLRPAEEPTYSTPDPPRRALTADVRPVPADYWRRYSGMSLIRTLVDSHLPPLFALLGLSGGQVDEGQWHGVTMPASN